LFDAVLKKLNNTRMLKPLEKGDLPEKGGHLLRMGGLRPLEHHLHVGHAVFCEIQNALCAVGQQLQQSIGST
jgi:hypothetical protein